MNTLHMNSLVDLYVHKLENICSAEEQLVNTLPKIARLATSPSLQAALKNNFDESQRHLSEIDRVLQRLEPPDFQPVSIGMQGILEEGRYFFSRTSMPPEVRDAALISLLQHSEHYKMASYGTLCNYAALLGQKEDYEVLSDILESEKALDEEFTKLAEREINENAEVVEEIMEEVDETEQQCIT